MHASSLIVLLSRWYFGRMSALQKELVACNYFYFLLANVVLFVSCEELLLTSCCNEKNLKVQQPEIHLETLPPPTEWEGRILEGLSRQIRFPWVLTHSKILLNYLECFSQFKIWCISCRKSSPQCTEIHIHCSLLFIFSTWSSSRPCWTKCKLKSLLYNFSPSLSKDSAGCDDVPLFEPINNVFLWKPSLAQPPWVGMRGKLRNWPHFFGVLT